MRHKIDRSARDDTDKENGEADGERAAADAEQLLELEPDLLRPVGEVAGDGGGDLLRLGPRELLLGQMHDDPERLVGMQLARPAHDELLGVLVELLLAEGRWVEGVEQPQKKLIVPSASKTRLTASTASCFLRKWANVPFEKVDAKPIESPVCG